MTRRAGTNRARWAGRRLAAAAVVVAGAVTAIAGSPAGAGVVPDPVGPPEVVVRLAPGTTATIDDVNRRHGTSVLAPSSGIPGAYLVRIPAGADPELVANDIATDPGVLYATPNVVLSPPEVDQDRVYAWRVYAWGDGDPLPGASAYAPGLVNLAAAQRLSTGAGVTVAMVDGGVQLNHPTLAASLAPGWDVVQNDADPSETTDGMDNDGDGLIDEGAGHGTHVAGIIHQVAPGARIMPVRVLDDDGSGTVWNTAEGILWASTHGARIVNASLGTHGSASILKDVVTAVAANGTLVVGAAGNDGKDRRMFPGAAPEALAVTAVGPGDVVPSFANFGRWVDVAAPGENIHSTFFSPPGSYASNSGTSMATPFVAGEAALVAALRPTAGPAELAAVIRATASPIDGKNPLLTGQLGAGRIDMAAAVTAP